MGVALLFIDGVGVGLRDPALNPLACEPFLLSHFQDGSGTPLPPQASLYRVDAAFGVPGRPQSASGQAAIFTGDPAPALIGEHVLGFPDRRLRELLSHRSIVKRLLAAGRTATFVNCYPAGYLDALGLLRRESAAAEVVIPPRAVRRLRPSASTLAMAAAGIALRTLDDARGGLGLTADIDGSLATRRGLKVPRRSAEEAAQVFWAVSREVDFALFEHYAADEAGHAQDLGAALDALRTFDAFARQVLAQRPAGWDVLICSDHGNVEDLSTRSHTLHAVPLLHAGDQPLPFPPRDIADAGKLVLALCGVPA